MSARDLWHFSHARFRLQSARQQITTTWSLDSERPCTNMRDLFSLKRVDRTHVRCSALPLEVGQIDSSRVVCIRLDGTHASAPSLNIQGLMLIGCLMPGGSSQCAHEPHPRVSIKSLEVVLYFSRSRCHFCSRPSEIGATYFPWSHTEPMEHLSSTFPCICADIDPAPGTCSCSALLLSCATRPGLSTFELQLPS